MHLSYYTQRDEIRDVIASAKLVYEQRLALSFPISMVATREQEIEERLRWLERKLHHVTDGNRSPRLLARARGYVLRLIRTIRNKPSSFS